MTPDDRNAPDRGKPTRSRQPQRGDSGPRDTHEESGRDGGEGLPPGGVEQPKNDRRKRGDLQKRGL